MEEEQNSADHESTTLSGNDQSKFGSKERSFHDQKLIEDVRNAAKREIESLKKDIFTLFGIFASFIAFIVGEINILKTIDSIYDKLGFSFIFVSLMLGFLFGMMFLVNEEGNVQKASKMKSVFVTFFTIGMAFILLGKLEIVLHVIKILN